MLSGKLSKQDLAQIFKDIKELVGEKYFLDVFKKLNFHKQEENISDPYVLFSVINEIIENKEEPEQENEKMEKNKKIMNSLLKDENKVKEHVNV